MGRAQRLGIAIGIGLVIATAISLVILAGNSPEADRKDRSPVAGLQCPAGDLKGAMHRDFDPRAPGATDPEAAVQTYLTQEIPKIHVSALQRVAVGQTTVQFAFVENGKTIATFDTINKGFGWRFAGSSSCESFANKYRAS
jgi:hypothetical protein